MFAAQQLSEPAATSARTGHWSMNAKLAFTQHWPEYVIEGLCLGMFMISACIFAALLEHPASPVRMNIASPDLRRLLAGIAMGLTAILLIYSPLGQRSGAHMNPARSFASDFVGMQWQSIWIYFTAPLIGMLSAAELFVRIRGLHSVICAKLDHSGRARCIFRCGYMTQEVISAPTR